MIVNKTYRERSDLSDKPGGSTNPTPLDTLNSECQHIRIYCGQLRKSYNKVCYSQIVLKRTWLIIFPSIVAALAWGALLLPGTQGTGSLNWSLAEFFSDGSGWRHMVQGVAPVLAPICAVIAAISILAKVDQPPVPFQNMPAALSAVSLQTEYLLQLGKLSPPELLLPEVKDLQSRLLGMMRLFQPELTALPPPKGK